MGCYRLNGMVICGKQWSSRLHHRYDVPNAVTVIGEFSGDERVAPPSLA
jgi:hypothetical protein